MHLLLGTLNKPGPAICAVFHQLSRPVMARKVTTKPSIETQLGIFALEPHVCLASEPKPISLFIRTKPATDLLVIPERFGGSAVTQKVESSFLTSLSIKSTGAIAEAFSASPYEYMLWLIQRSCAVEMSKALGSAPSKESLLLDGEDGKGSRIRDPHPTSTLKHYGTRKRPREARWMDNSWWEGLVIDKGKEDEANLSKHMGTEETGILQASLPLRLSEKESVFTMGKSKKSDAHGTKYTGLQEGSLHFDFLQLLEGLQGSLTISKIPILSHDKGTKAHQKTAASRGTALRISSQEMMPGYVIIGSEGCPCRYGVKWLIEVDQEKNICCLQSRAGEPYLRYCDADQEDVLRRFIFVEGLDSYYEASTAALKIASYLPLTYNDPSPLVIIPTPLGDAVYDYVAENRYKWFGRDKDCIVMREQDLLDRFIEE